MGWLLTRSCGFGSPLGKSPTSFPDPLVLENTIVDASAKKKTVKQQPAKGEQIGGSGASSPCKVGFHYQCVI